MFSKPSSPRSSSLVRRVRARGRAHPAVLSNSAQVSGRAGPGRAGSRRWLGARGVGLAVTAPRASALPRPACAAAGLKSPPFPHGAPRVRARGPAGAEGAQLCVLHSSPPSAGARVPRAAPAPAAPPPRLRSSRIAPFLVPGRARRPHPRDLPPTQSGPCRPPRPATARPLARSRSPPAPLDFHPPPAPPRSPCSPRAGRAVARASTTRSLRRGTSTLRARSTPTTTPAGDLRCNTPTALLRFVNLT